VIAGLVLSEVTLWQWRTVIAARGRRGLAMLLGMLGAVLQITAISQVVTNLQDPLGILAYALGVGLGVLFGLVAGDRLTPGSVSVRVVTGSEAIAEGLWARGWPATVHVAQGVSGPVTILDLEVSRRDEPRLHGDVLELAPDASWSIGDIRSRPLLAGPPGEPPSRPRAVAGLDGPASYADGDASSEAAPR
jgi:uncharacterized protein YebE (UPF0316 family)